LRIAYIPDHYPGAVLLHTSNFDQQKKIEEEIKVANIELGKVLAENEAKTGCLTGTGQLNEKMQGQQSEKELSGNILKRSLHLYQSSCGYILFV
jgi:hypothetical protein